jgi:L-ascorbate metabolism protein UlaG (beta-lactamase superfamily)
MKVTYYGHSSFLVEAGGKKLLFDPFIKGNPLASKIDVSKIIADYILISHAHSDHVGDALEIAGHNDATIIGPNEVVNWFLKKGVKNGHNMGQGGFIKFDFGKVRLVNAIHSSQFQDGSPGGNPAGFVIETTDGNFYHSGDTALTMDMQLIPTRTRLNFALLCIGGNYTMDIEDAVNASDFIECDKIVGMHYNTFPVITINKKEATSLFEKNGKELILMEIGETRDL